MSRGRWASAGCARAVFPCQLLSYFGTMMPPHEARHHHTKRATMKSLVVKRSIVLAGHKTSVSLEDEFWIALKKIAGDRNVMLSGLVGSIHAQRQHGNFSSALRLFVLEYYRGKAAEKLGDEMLVSGICGTSSCFANALRRRVSVVISAPAPVSP